MVLGEINVWGVSSSLRTMMKSLWRDGIDIIVVLHVATRNGEDVAHRKQDSKHSADVRCARIIVAWIYLQWRYVECERNMFLTDLGYQRVGCEAHLHSAVCGMILPPLVRKATDLLVGRLELPMLL